MAAEIEKSSGAPLQPGLARAAAADERGLIPQPHGGALRPPWGSGTGAAAARSPWRATRRRALQLAHDATAHAMQTLIGMLDDPDPRCRAVAADQILNRSLGKPGEVPRDEGEGQSTGSVNLKLLDAAERERLGVALAVVAELTALARERESAQGESA